VKKVETGRAACERRLARSLVGRPVELVAVRCDDETVRPVSRGETGGQLSVIVGTLSGDVVADIAEFKDPPSSMT